MSAADSLKSLEQRALAMRSLRVVLIVAVALLVLLATYCAGRAHGAKDQKITVLDSVHTVLVDTIHAVEHRIVVDTQRVRVAKDGATVAHAAFDTAAAQVLAVADTARSIPDSLVVPAIHLCTTALTADSIAYVALGAAFTDMTTDRNAQRDRADTDEAEMKILKPPRFGFKTGAVTGVLAVLTLLHFLR